MEDVRQDNEFEQIRKTIVDELGFYGLTNDEIMSALAALVSIEAENFDKHANLLVLRKYYTYFLNYIAPSLLNMVRANNNSEQLEQRFFDLKKTLNGLNQELFDNVLEVYGYFINDGYLENAITESKQQINPAVASAKRQDMFRVAHNYDENIVTRHPDIKYNYNPLTWETFINDNIRPSLREINRYLNSQIPDFEENLSHYERHILLYKEYKMKYEKIKSITDGRSR